MALTADAALAMLGASKPKYPTYVPGSRPGTTQRSRSMADWRRGEREDQVQADLRQKATQRPKLQTSLPKSTVTKKGPTDWLASLLDPFNQALSRGAEANVQTGMEANAQVNRAAASIPAALPGLGEAATQALANFSDMLNQGADANLAVQKVATGGQPIAELLAPRADTTWQDATTPYTDADGNVIVDPESGFNGAPPETTPTVTPDTYLQQLYRWRQQMNSILGLTPGLLPDTYGIGWPEEFRHGQLWRLVEQSLGQVDPLQDSGGGGGWWSDYGGGGGGYTPRNPEWWLGLTNWRI